MGRASQVTHSLTPAKCAACVPLWGEQKVWELQDPSASSLSLISTPGTLASNGDTKHAGTPTAAASSSTKGARFRKKIAAMQRSGAATA